MDLRKKYQSYSILVSSGNLKLAKYKKFNQQILEVQIYDHVAIIPNILYINIVQKMLLTFLYPLTDVAVYGTCTPNIRQINEKILRRYENQCSGSVTF